MIPRPPSAPSTSTKKKSVTISSPDSKRKNNNNSSSTNNEDFSSSSVPTWARRGISWKSIREVFDDEFTQQQQQDRTKELLDLEDNNVNEAMTNYASLYDEVGLTFLNDVCADVEPEEEFDVREQIQRKMEQDHSTHRASIDAKKANAGSIAFCFNCREPGHTHSVCPKPRRCYICHDPRHDAFVCVANPVQGSEFFEPEIKCAICGDRGHQSQRCKSRGGPWQGKPGYAHLPDTTYPRPLVIHTGSRTSANKNNTKQDSQQSSSSTRPTDSRSARDIILNLAEQYRPKSDYELMKLMREPELFCGSIPLLAHEKISGTQRIQLKQALEVLRPSVAGVDLASFGVVLNEKNQSNVATKKEAKSRGASSNSGTGNVLDDEAALNELRTSSVDFNVVFGNHIEKYSRSESSAGFRVGLQKIQSKTGLRPQDINLYDDDEIASRINRQVVNAAKAAQKAHQRAVILQKEIDRGLSGGGGGGSSSTATTTTTSSSQASSRSSSPNNNTSTMNQQGRVHREDSSSVGGGVHDENATTVNNDSPHSASNNASSPTTTTTKQKKVPLGRTTRNIFKGTAVRSMRNQDPTAAEKRARARREAAGEATLMRWTRLLSQGVDVETVTSQEAASSTNTSLSKHELKAAAEDDLLRLMKAAVNRGESDVIEGKKLSIPRVQHGTIGRESIMRTWAQHKMQLTTSSSKSGRTNNKLSASQNENDLFTSQEPQSATAAVFLTEPTSPTTSRNLHRSPPPSPRNNTNNTGAKIRLRRKSSVAFVNKLDSPSNSTTTGKSPKRKSSSPRVLVRSPTISPNMPSRAGADDDFAVVDFSLGSSSDYAAAAAEKDLEEKKKLATPRSNYKDDRGGLGREGLTIRLPDRCTTAQPGDEPIRNWNAHRVALQWGKKQQQKSSNTNNTSNEDEDHVDVWLHARKLYDKQLNEAKQVFDQTIEEGRRGAMHDARQEFDSTMKRLGQPPEIGKVIDPDIVSKWKGRFQTARIRAGVKDAALKESRLVHRSVVASARLGGAAVCDGATKRAERWLRSHRDVESTEGSTSLISEHSSMWTILCHRIAIAAVRVRAKRELAEELRAFLSRLPQKKATQDESIRMVAIFEDFVYGDDTTSKLKEELDKSARLKMDMNASFADFMMMQSFSNDGDMMERSQNRHQHQRPRTASTRNKTTLDKCMEEWMLGSKRDEAKKKKKLSENAENARGENDGENRTNNNNVPHYAQARNIDSQIRKSNQLQQQQALEAQKKQLSLMLHNNNNNKRKRKNSPGSSSIGMGGGVSDSDKIKSVESFSSFSNNNKHQQQQGPTPSPSSPTTTTMVGSAASATLLPHHRQASVVLSDDQYSSGIGGAGDSNSDLTSTQALLILQQQQKQNPGMMLMNAKQQQEFLKLAAAGGGAQQQAAAAATTSSHTRPSDLERLLSAPVTSQDVERLIEKACRESYSHLFDDDELRLALPSTVIVWPKDDPRRAAPRTQEGECVAAFLRWIVSPAAIEGVLGRIVSKFTTSAGFFDYDMAIEDVYSSGPGSPDTATMTNGASPLEMTEMTTSGFGFGYDNNATTSSTTEYYKTSSGKLIPEVESRFQSGVLG